MSFTERNIKGIIVDSAEIANSVLGDYLVEVCDDVSSFIRQNKEDFDRWYNLYTSGRIGKDYFVWLLKSKKELVFLTELSKMGVSLIKLEQFREKIIDTIIKTAIGGIAVVLGKIFH